MIPIIVIGAIVVLLVLYVMATYNGLVKLRNRAEEAFSDIDTQLKRRHDLIPNLIETVKGYAAHERQTFDSVTQARNMAAGAHGPAEQAVAENALTRALGGLFAVAEAYPDLKANQNFLELQNELTDTEDKIQASRRFYNMNVRDLNIKIESVPSNIVAGFGKFEQREFFEIEDPHEREVPQVSFDTTPPATAPPTPAAPSAPAGGGGGEPPAVA